MAHIRPYRASDEEAVLFVFRETAAPDLRAHPDPDVLHVGSFMWCRPYIMLNPEWCWVLDDGAGKAVGYVICAPDTRKFVDRFKREFFPVIASYGVEEPSPSADANNLAVQLKKDAYQPENMLHHDYPALLQQYPAHLHIDVLSSHQGQRWGEKLIDTLLEKLGSENIKGVHLGMAAANDGAGRFYKRLGFQPFDEMHDEGQTGRKGGAIYFVKKTEGQATVG